MASISANGSKGRHRFTLEVTQGSQNVTNNTTTVNFTFKLAPIDTGWNWTFNYETPVSYTITINGTNYTGSIMSYDGSSTVTVKSGSQTITHNSDGTKSLSFSFSVTSLSDKYSYLPGSASASGSMTLTTIPRASTLTVSNGTLNVKQTISVTRQSTSFTHTIYMKCSSSSNTTICTKSTTTSFDVTPPASYATYYTSGTSATVTFTIETYNGNTKIGTNTYNISCAIPNNSTFAPTCSLGSASDPAGYYGTYGVYVQNKSKIKIKATGSGKQGATIKSYAVTINGVKYSSQEPTSDVINKSGSVSISATCTDSRGYTSAAATTTVSFAAYSAPTISALTVGRYSDSAGSTADITGEYAKITYTASFTQINSNKNSATVTIQYKKHADSSYTNSSVNGSSTMSGSTSAFAAVGDSTYDILMTVKDKLSTTTKSVMLSTAVAPMHFNANGKAMGIGMVSPSGTTGKVDFGWNIRVSQQVNPAVELVSPQGASSLYELSTDTSGIQRIYLKANGDTSWTNALEVTKSNLYAAGNIRAKAGALYSGGINYPSLYLDANAGGHFLIQHSNSSSGSVGMYVKDSSDSSWTPFLYATKGYVNMPYFCKVQTYSATQGNKSIANNSWTAMQSFTLTKGYWLLEGRVGFALNTSGRRGMSFSTSATAAGSEIHRANCAPVSGSDTTLRVVTLWGVSAASETVYLNCIQTSGSALNAYSQYSTLLLYKVA